MITAWAVPAPLPAPIGVSQIRQITASQRLCRPPVGASLRAWFRDPLEQQLQWRGPEPLARLRDRARGRDLPVIPPYSGKQQARDKEAHHLFICIAEEQAQGQHVIDHDPRRQQPGPLLCPPGFGEHVIDQVTVDKARQDPYANPVSQTRT